MAAATKPKPEPTVDSPKSTPAPAPEPTEELKPVKNGIVYKDRKGRFVDPNGFFCDEYGNLLEG